MFAGIKTLIAGAFVLLIWGAVWTLWGFLNLEMTEVWATDPFFVVVPALAGMASAAIIAHFNYKDDVEGFNDSPWVARLNHLCWQLGFWFAQWVYWQPYFLLLSLL